VNSENTGTTLEAFRNNILFAGFGYLMLVRQQHLPHQFVLELEGGNHIDLAEWALEISRILQ